MYTKNCDICGLVNKFCVCKNIDQFFKKNKHLFKYDPQPKAELKKPGVTYPRLYTSKCIICYRFPCKCKSRVWC